MRSKFFLNIKNACQFTFFYYNFVHLASIPRAEKKYLLICCEIFLFYFMCLSKAVKAPIYLASNKDFFIFASVSRDQGAVKEGLEAEWELVISLPSFLTFTFFFLCSFCTPEGDQGGRVGAGNLFTFLPNIYLLSVLFALNEPSW
jgi:hypothetical protein